MNSGLMPDQILVDLGDNYKALAQEMKNCYMKEPEGHITHQIIPVEEVLSHLVEFARIRMTENYIRRTIEKIYGLRFNDHGSRLATIASLIVADLWTVFSTMKFCDELDDILPYHYRICLLYTSPSPRDRTRSRMPSSA